MSIFTYYLWLAQKTASPGPTVQPAPQPKPTPSATAVFDDFNGPAGSVPNPELWMVPTGDTQPDTNQGVGKATADNTFLDGNGNLVIRSQKTASGWTTGWLTSWGKPQYGYGKFSASIKMPPGPGKDSGIWLLGAQYFDANVLEPQCGEIDIIEYIGDGRYYSTVHGPMAYSGSPWNQTWTKGGLAFDPTAGFHTYWCEHTPQLVIWGIDGTTTGAATPKSIGPGSTWVLDQQFDVLFSTIVGNGMSGAPTAATPPVFEMLVDWFLWEPATT